MIPNDEDRDLPEVGDDVNKYQYATETRDPATAFHALAAEFEERAANLLDTVEIVDPDENPAEWAQSKGMLDTYQSAAVTARTVALAWDARDDGEDREEVRK